mmetsp:Transcript_53213/g.128905  ORF Transcript_53213/g.128905 Transcript_53213/m.128905 type:complete len:228 (-) Transcript_53213:83-766(-)
MGNLLYLQAALLLSFTASLWIGSHWPISHASTWGKYVLLFAAAWCFNEAAFWAWMKLFFMPSCQGITEPPKMCKAERMRLWERCMRNPGMSAQDFARGWFFDVEFEKITREDCDRWLAWGMWGLTLEQLTDEDKQEMEGLVTMLEAKCGGHKFPPRDPSVGLLKCGTYTLDPVPHKHYYLFAYVLTMVIFEAMFRRAMWKRGFKVGAPRRDRCPWLTSADMQLCWCA